MYLNAAVIKNSIIWDAHSCPSLTLDADLSTLHTIKDSGYTFVSLNVGFEPNTKKEVLSVIKNIKTYLSDNSESFKLIQTTNDILVAKKENKLAISFDIEGLGPFESQVENIEFFHQLGVKQIALVYNQNNKYGGGCFDEDRGLISYGYKYIEEINRLGILIDCSHAGYRTCLDIINASKSPVIFSHSNPKKLCDHKRNIEDELIIACAQKKGVIGLNGINIFLANNHLNINNFVDHIDYIVDLVGVEHVGIGFDYIFEREKTIELVYKYPDEFSFIESECIEMMHPKCINELVDELINRFYSISDIQKIIGSNFFNVASAVWG